MSTQKVEHEALINRAADAAPVLHLCLHWRRSGAALSEDRAHSESQGVQKHCGYELKTQESLVWILFTDVQCETPAQLGPLTLIFTQTEHRPSLII